MSKRLMLHTVTLKYNNGSYQYQIFANLSAAGITLGPKLDFATGVCVCVGGGGGGGGAGALSMLCEKCPPPPSPIHSVFQF